MKIEFPPESGVFADYSDEERLIVREFYFAADRGEITVEERDRVVGLIHDAKVLLDARLANPEEEPDFSAPEQTVIYIPDPDSPFQIPGKAKAKLGLPAAAAAEIVEPPSRLSDEE